MLFFRFANKKENAIKVETTRERFCARAREEGERERRGRREKAIAFVRAHSRCIILYKTHT